MGNYTVKQLAKLAGVSVRTLHHYDQLGLLSPSVRTGAGYRQYGEKELIRLQQILFYKELDFPLKEIQEILDDPAFDYLSALDNHKKAIEARRERLNTLLATINKTILKLKGEKTMLTNEDLYAGFPKEKAEAYRKEAIEKYGRETVEKSENNLRKIGKEGIEQLKAESAYIVQSLAGLMHLDPTDTEVQKQVARHYKNIQQFWGGAVPNESMTEAYWGLAKLYVEDKRFYAEQGAGFAEFLSKAMLHFVETTLK